MSVIAREVSPEVAGAAAAANDAWYLHSQGRRFGPLSEDELRGYFRAGMVKAGDTIGIPEQSGTVSATQVATMLGIEAPLPAAGAASSLPPPITRIIITGESEIDRSRVGWLAVLLVFVSLVGVAYFALHKPATAPEPMEFTFAPEVAPASMTVEPDAPITAANAGPEFAIRRPAPVQGAESTDTAPAAAETPASLTYFDSLSVPQTETQAVAPAQAPVDIWWSRAAELKDAKDWNGLEAHSRKWTESDPRVSLAWHYLGTAKYFQRDFAAAIAAFRQSLSLSPDEFPVRWALALSYSHVHRDQEAAAILNELVRVQPGNTSLWTSLGISYSHLGEYDESIRAFRRVVELEPGNREGWRALGQTYAHFGYMDKANAAMDKANGR